MQPWPDLLNKVNIYYYTLHIWTYNFLILIYTCIYMDNKSFHYSDSQIKYR